MKSVSGRALERPRRKRSATYEIVDALGTAIVTGAYPERTPFPEVELCRQYGVSRPVLREAVKMLTAKGLVGSLPRAGTWVQPQSKWNMLDPDVLNWLLQRKFDPSLLIKFNQMRLAIEPAAAGLAADAPPEAKAAITAALNRMQEAELGRDDPLAADIAFHVAVIRASGNCFLEQLTELSETALRFSIRHTNAASGRPGNVADHARVADAIIEGDAFRAETYMRTLILQALDALQRSLPLPQ
jgi:DNA-binding FadR family transcriptional regulator